jgi:hypothetical protein
MNGAANGHDPQLERDLAAAVPAVVEAPAVPPEDLDQAASGETGADPDQERAQRLTSRETEMAQLLSEIFGKR